MSIDYASEPQVAAPGGHPSGWTYDEAFKRNRGLISESEQQKMRSSRVAIAGMGGVGGSHLTTLTRLGIGRFTIADPDVFEVANFNRQQGATISNLGRNKAEAMAATALDINPELDLRVMPAAIDEGNVDAFLDGADLFVDGLDFFAIEARRLVFRRAAEKGMWGITAGPIGFSTAWLSFDPNGMSFDEYFDLNDRMDQLDKLIAFAVGLTPRATHLKYMDMSQANIAERTGPSASLACQLASGVIGSGAVSVLLDRKKSLHPAPCYQQFDPYRVKKKTGRLRWGNRGVIQRLKRTLLRDRFSGTVLGFPPIHKFASLIMRQNLAKQTLERTPEPEAITDQEAHVAAYDQVMETKLAIPYSLGLEVIYRTRKPALRGKALDLACGPGHMSLYLAKQLELDSIEGIDLSGGMVETANMNAKRQGVRQANFAVGDVTDLSRYADGAFDLCTFCDAAHHMPDLGTVARVLEEMDRVTKPDGLVLAMDLVRLKTKEITNDYVKAVAKDYAPRGLEAFRADFQNSMYAAWTVEELATAVPTNSTRCWFQWTPNGLPTIQFLIGAPASTDQELLMAEAPSPARVRPSIRSLGREWGLARRTLNWGARRPIVGA